MAQKKEGKLSAMTTKQKAIIAALVVILIIMIWQLMGLLGGDKGAPVLQPTTQLNKQAPGAMMAGAPGTPGAPATNLPPVPGANPAMSPPNSPVMPQATSEQPQLRESNIVMDNQILDLQKKSEQKYIDQLNQLQMLKIQREIAETNQAIASARLATVTAEKNVSDLLTKPSQPSQPGGGPPLNQAVTTEGISVTTEGGVTIPVPPTPPPPPPIAVAAPLPVVETPYSVISISMQMGRWSAVVAYQSKLFNVSIGDVLPIDGSIVACINKNGIVLVKDKKRRRISIISTLS